jgi:hypothetical protein
MMSGRYPVRGTDDVSRGAFQRLPECHSRLKPQTGFLRDASPVVPVIESPSIDPPFFNPKGMGRRDANSGIHVIESPGRTRLTEAGVSLTPPAPARQTMLHLRPSLNVETIRLTLPSVAATLVSGSQFRRQSGRNPLICNVLE